MTAHDKLIASGWEKVFDEKYLVVYYQLSNDYYFSCAKQDKTISVYSHFYKMHPAPITLEFAEIIVQYLKEVMK